MHLDSLKGFYQLATFQPSLTGLLRKMEHRTLYFRLNYWEIKFLATTILALRKHSIKRSFTIDTGNMSLLSDTPHSHALTSYRNKILNNISRNKLTWTTSVVPVSLPLNVWYDSMWTIQFSACCWHLGRWATTSPSRTSQRSQLYIPSTVLTALNLTRLVRLSRLDLMV